MWCLVKHYESCILLLSIALFTEWPPPATINLVPTSHSAAVLVLYLNYFLTFDEDFATTIYHAFVALCYLTPILGAIIADSWLGKYKWGFSPYLPFHLQRNILLWSKAEASMISHLEFSPPPLSAGLSFTCPSFTQWVRLSWRWAPFMTSRTPTGMASPTTWPSTCELKTLSRGWETHDTDVCDPVCVCVCLSPEHCPCWVWFLSPWEQEASSPAWPPLVGTSLKSTRWAPAWTFQADESVSGMRGCHDPIATRACTRHMVKAHMAINSMTHAVISGTWSAVPVSLFYSTDLLVN